MALADREPAVRRNRWTRAARGADPGQAVPPPPVPEVPRPRAAPGPSYVLQHYHSTGCAGGAFSWRAAMLNPEKRLFLCEHPREYRETSLEDIRFSLADKRRGGGPRVGPFQECIPGEGWRALPKYDFTTRNRSSAFNERMHVEWENHADHILANGGELPVASVVAKAGFRSCAPCCRDMLALARPTGKTFIMVDIAEDDGRGTFHFVAGDQYLPVPKEACNPEQIMALKRLVADAQAGFYTSSEQISSAVLSLGVPVDEAARGLYLGDRALLPAGCAKGLRGRALLEVLHAEHFARLPAEYGASILRDRARPEAQREAVRRCRALARQQLVAAWRPHFRGLDLEGYAEAAVAPLLPEEPEAYERLRRAVRALPRAPRLTAERLQAIDEASPGAAAATALVPAPKTRKEEDSRSVAEASTALPEDSASSCIDLEAPSEA